MTEPTTTGSTIPDGDFTPEEEIESLARAIHQGDWMMVMEWRWERARRAEQDVAFRRAEAIMAAHALGAHTSDEFADVIASIEWTVKSGSPGRLRAKADKVVQWFHHRQRGTLI